MINARIWIYYKDKIGKLKHEPQGKMYQLNGKWIFLMDKDKQTDKPPYGNYMYRIGGWSIAKQITDEFRKLKIRPQFIFRVKETGTLYYFTVSLLKHVLLTSWGEHSQYMIPAEKCKVKNEQIEEPHGLPDMDLFEWVKTMSTKEDKVSPEPLYVVKEVYTEVSPDKIINQRIKLGEIYKKAMLTKRDLYNV